MTRDQKPAEEYPDMAAATAIAPTPLRFEDRYKKLEVDQGAGRKFYVQVWHYRNNSSTTTGHETVEAKAKAMGPLIAKVREASRKDLGLKHAPHGSHLSVRKSDAEIEPGGSLYSPGIAFEDVDTASIVRTFVGKGTPGDIAGTLRLALRYGLVKPDTASLQAYCDTYIGLDCSGFVGNYLNEALGAGIDVMETEAASYREPVGNRRRTIESIRENDTLAWAHTNHVAVIDSIGADWLQHFANKAQVSTMKGMQVVVVESNGGKGLNHDTYTVKSVDAHGVFKVRRSYQANDMSVYITSRP